METVQLGSDQGDIYVDAKRNATQNDPLQNVEGDTVASEDMHMNHAAALEV